MLRVEARVYLSPWKLHALQHVLVPIEILGTLAVSAGELIPVWTGP